MDGENGEEATMQQSNAENETALDQNAISPIADGLLPPNDQESNNVPNEIETSTPEQNSATENENDSAQNEITSRTETLLPQNETENAQDQPPPSENENTPSSEPINQENQSPSNDLQSPTDNTIQNEPIQSQDESLQQQEEQPPVIPDEDGQNTPNAEQNVPDLSQSQNIEQPKPSTPNEDAQNLGNIEQNEPQNDDEPPIPQVAIPNTARISTQAPRHFYPSMPQTARAGKSCRFVKTRPGTSRTNPYISRKISSFSVPIVQLRASYLAMDTQLHSLVANCNIEAISPELMMVYKRVDNAYDLFCKQANLLLSSQDPNATPRQQEKTSAIYKVSEELVNEWVTFIKLFNSTISRGSTPFFQIISGRLSRILSIFRSLNERTNIGMVRIAMTRDGVRRVDSEIILLRRECNAKFRNKEHIDQIFTEKVKNVTTRVENVFRNSVTKATMYTAEIMRLKSDMQVEVSDLRTNVDAMLNFDTSAGLTRAEIAKVNEVFNSLFQLMRLPLELKLKYEDEMSENEKAATKEDEEAAKKREAESAKKGGRKIEKGASMKVCMFENMV